MEIKILGPGCSKCKVTEKQVIRAVKESGRNDVKITKVENLEEIMKYNIMRTPGLVVDNQLVIAGRIPTNKELKKLLEQ